MLSNHIPAPSGVQFGNLAQYLFIQLGVSTRPVSLLLVSAEFVRLVPARGASYEFTHGSEEYAKAVRLVAQLPALENV
jgi:hypothetical protein